jgi:hypothetical protein
MIRTLVISPEVDLSVVDRVRLRIEEKLGGESFTILVVGEEPGPERRAQLATHGATWVLWSPFQENELRFLVHSAMVLPSQLARRAFPRAPLDARVAMSIDGRACFGRMITLAAGGAFIQSEALPAPDSLIHLGFGLNGDVFELEARVVTVVDRHCAWKPSLPRGIGVAFEDLDSEVESSLQDAVKEILTRYSP